jgi:purine-nucleoside phosphorylase
VNDVDRDADAAAAGAAFLCERLGRPALGVVLGSGFDRLAPVLGAGEPVPFDAIHGYPARRAPGHGGGVAAITVHGRIAWVFRGRLHTYEGLDALAAAHPVRLLAGGGATGVLLTCAAGGLLSDDRPGDFAVVTDHINLLGDDPIRHLSPCHRSPAFLDLQRAYDAAWADSWRTAAVATGAQLRNGILAALPGPSYETPAEVRMLRALGADLASMSVVPETILARYLGLRVAAIVCISNRGAGMDGGEAIAHDEVVDVVGRTVTARAALFRNGLAAMIP